MIPKVEMLPLPDGKKVIVGELPGLGHGILSCGQLYCDTTSG